MSEELPLLERTFSNHNLGLYRPPILISLWLGSFLSSLDGTIVANIMSPIAAEFNESNQKQWIATSFLLTNTAFQPMYGKLSDLVGRKNALLLAHTMFALGCLLTSMANNITQFSIARAVCGMGAGGVSAMSSIVVSDICTPKERGVYQGYANIVFGAGQILGGPIGGFLLGTIGWKLIFLLQVPVSITCMILAYTNVNIKLDHIPKEKFTKENLEKLNLIGSLSLVGVISGLLFLLSSPLNKTIVSTCTVVALIIFIINERSVDGPYKTIPWGTIKGSFALCSLVTLLSSFLTVGDIFRSPIYLQTIQNISLVMTGTFLLLPAMFTSIGSVVTGWILRSVNHDLETTAYWCVFGGALLQAIGLFTGYELLSFLQADTSMSNYWPVIYILASICVMVGYSAVLVASLVSIVATIDRSQQATITGLFYLWRSIGSVFGESVILGVYENVLEYKLTHHLDSKKLVKKLLQNSTYLRELQQETFAKVIVLYKSAFLWSYAPSFIVGIVSLLLALKLVMSHKI